MTLKHINKKIKILERYDNYLDRMKNDPHSTSLTAEEIQIAKTVNTKELSYLLTIKLKKQNEAYLLSSNN
jgi:hypothetical protein